MKRLLLLPSFLVLLVSVAAIAPAIAGPGGGRGGDRMEKVANELGLTDTQRQQMKQLHETMREQMKSVLTAEQRAQMEANKQQGQRQRPNLTDAQKEQMRAIREQHKQQVQAILTPEQFQKLQEMRQSRRPDRQSNRQDRQSNRQQ